MGEKSRRQKVQREAPGLKAKAVGSSRRVQKGRTNDTSRSIGRGTESLLAMDVLPNRPQSSDSIDGIIQSVDQHGDDKYHLFDSEEADSMDDSRPSQQTQNAPRLFSTIQPPAVRNHAPLTASPPSYEGTEASNYSELQPPSKTRNSRRAFP